MCRSLDGPSLDAAVVAAFFAALAPAELAVLDEVLAAQRDEREQSAGQYADQVARAEYEARLARRRYQAVDPDHRLVAAELERRWELALRAAAEARETAERFARAPVAPALAPALRAQLADLGRRLPALWRSGRLTPAHQKELLRSLVRRVVVTRPAPDAVAARVLWVSGAVTPLAVRPPVHRGADRREYGRPVERALALAAEGHPDPEVARRLTAEGFRAARCPDVPPTLVERLADVAPRAARLPRHGRRPRPGRTAGSGARGRSRGGRGHHLPRPGQRPATGATPARSGGAGPLLPALAAGYATVTLGGARLWPVATLEQRARGGYGAVVRALVAEAGPRPGERVLEAGCGPGVILRWLARRTGGANPLVGVDANRYLLREAARLAQGEGVAARIRFQEGDAEALPFPPASFDVALACTVLEEGDADRMLRELVRVTAPGGRVAVVVRATDLPALEQPAAAPRPQSDDRGVPRGRRRRGRLRRRESLPPCPRRRPRRPPDGAAARDHPPRPERRGRPAQLRERPPPAAEFRGDARVADRRGAGRGGRQSAVDESVPLRGGDEALTAVGHGTPVAAGDAPGGIGQVVTPPALGGLRRVCERAGSGRPNWSRAAPIVAPQPRTARRGAPAAGRSYLGVVVSPEGIRTPGLLVRSQTLYPAELRGHTATRLVRPREVRSSPVRASGERRRASPSDQYTRSSGAGSPGGGVRRDGIRWRAAGCRARRYSLELLSPSS